MQYKVIVEDAARGLMGDSGMEAAADILSEKVNEAIKDGWEPLGGIAHSENRQENPFLLQILLLYTFDLRKLEDLTYLLKITC